MELRELKNRRKALVEKMPKNSIAILSSANRNYRTRDVENPYRQDSDFLYMTGISEPNLINIVFEKSGEIFSVLFRNNTSEHEKIWDGSILENSDILENSGFSEVQSYDDYEEKILNYIIDKDSIYIESGLNPELDDFIYEKISKSGKDNRKNSIFPKK